jgi:hypothetical protein
MKEEIFKSFDMCDHSRDCYCSHDGKKKLEFSTMMSSSVPMGVVVSLMSFPYKQSPASSLRITYFEIQKLNYCSITKGTYFFNNIKISDMRILALYLRVSLVPNPAIAGWPEIPHSIIYNMNSLKPFRDLIYAFIQQN